MIALITAHDKNRVIGANDKIPWDIKTDMSWFKTQTKNHIVVMGRKTFESIGRPLPYRTNIVLTRDKAFKHEGITVCHSSIDVYDSARGRKVFIIGGEEVYKQFIPLADELYITEIDHEFDGDTYFPEYNKSKYTTDFQTSCFDQFNLTFSILRRK